MAEDTTVLVLSDEDEGAKKPVLFLYSLVMMMIVQRSQ